MRGFGAPAGARGAPRMLLRKRRAGHFSNSDHSKLFISEYLLTELFLLKHGDSKGLVVHNKVMSVPSAGCGRVRRKGALLMKHATAVCCLPSSM